MRSWHHCSRPKLYCTGFLAGTPHTYALPFCHQAEGSLPAPVWMSAGGLLAPKAFCMNYSVWFLHIKTWHPHTTTPPLTYTQYSIRSWFHLATILDQCQTFFKESSSFCLLKYHLLKYFFFPFQIKHALWSISSFLFLPLQSCLCGADWMNWSCHSVVPTSSVTPHHTQDNIHIFLRWLAGSSTICPRLTQSLSPQRSHLTLLL